MSQDRATFQQLAEERFDEALKSRIAARFRENEIPDRTLVLRVYTHDLGELLSLAGLKDDLRADMEEE